MPAAGHVSVGQRRGDDRYLLFRNEWVLQPTCSRRHPVLTGALLLVAAVDRRPTAHDPLPEWTLWQAFCAAWNVGEFGLRPLSFPMACDTPPLLKIGSG